MPQTAQDERQQVQDLAIRAAQDIKLQSDYTAAEYVCAIYRDGDTLRATPLYTEHKDFQVDIRSAIQAAGGADNVVALVHNHPQAIVDRSSNQADTLKANRLPSQNDWNSARGQFGDRTDVSLFVLDPDDKFRRYDYADRDRWLREVTPNRFDRDGYNPRPSATIDVPERSATDPVPRQPGAQPGHEGHLHAQARTAMQTLETSRGQPWSENSERMAACAAHLGEQNGYRDIVSIQLNKATEQHSAGELMCVQGRSSSPDPVANRAIIATADALATPVNESLRRIDALHEARNQSPLAQSEPQQVQAPMTR